IGVLVELKGGDAELARGIAMHVAAMNPPHIKASDVPAEFIAKEKEIELAKMSDKDKSKPAEILEKIISGKIAKIVNEVTLYGQPYVLDTNQTVEQALKAAGAEVLRFDRLAVGEGIEKKEDDFADEVLNQAGLDCAIGYRCESRKAVVTQWFCTLKGRGRRPISVPDTAARHGAAHSQAPWAHATADRPSRQPETMHPDLESSLLHCRNLPSPPAVALQIIELAQDPDADLATAARVIAMDPALSARLLRVANSPLYAGRRRVETLAQATTMLGLNATLSLALGFSLARGLRSTSGAAAEQERLWKRSVLSALAARLLGEHAGLERLEDLMLAGLLQDIGALALLQARPDA